MVVGYSKYTNLNNQSDPNIEPAWSWVLDTTHVANNLPRSNFELTWHWKFAYSL